jgi:hypothetical protein
MEYAHPPLGEAVEAVGGYYIFTREVVLDHPSGPVLYHVGCAVTDRSCCGLSGCGYAVVAGRILAQQAMPEGPMRVSTVEPVPEEWHEEISRAICDREGVSQVHFLLEDKGVRVVFRS